MKNRISWGINIFLVGVIIVLLILLFGDKIVAEKTSGDVQVAEESKANNQTDKVVASVGDKSITEKEWVDSLKEHYGKEILEQLINRKVVAQIAKKNDVTISDDELQRQMDYFGRQLQMTGEEENLSPESLKEEIKYSILFEEIITKDVVISDKEIKGFYEDNPELFNINKEYHLSHIILKDLEAAKQAEEELKDGASFKTLAMEISTDIYTRTDGGDLGWLEENSYLPEPYWTALKGLKKGDFSVPFKVDNGYAILYFEDSRPEKKYSFDEVKAQIRRQLAINQIEDTMSPLQFWNEVKVDWVYKEK